MDATPGPPFADALAEADLAVGQVRRVVVGGLAVALIRTEDGIYALEDSCPHAGAPLSEGVLREGHLVCAWHGWRFRAQDGVCPTFAAAPAARCRAVRIEGGRVFVEVPAP